MKVMGIFLLLLILLKSEYNRLQNPSCGVDSLFTFTFIRTFSKTWRMWSHVTWRMMISCWIWTCLKIHHYTAVS